MRETIFRNQKPIGVIRRCTNTGQIPNSGKPLIPDREWSDVDELKAVVKVAYAQDSLKSSGTG